MKKSYNDDDYIHYLYKITNNTNNMYYYGIHSTLKVLGLDPLLDGYWGSGVLIRKAISNEGIENFTKTIILTRSTRKEISYEETLYVTQKEVDDPMCYNIKLGGEEEELLGRTFVIDLESGVKKMISTKEFYENPDKYESVTKGMIVVLKKNQKGEVEKEEYLRITVEEYRLNTDLYISGLEYNIQKERKLNPEKYKNVILCKNSKDFSDIKHLKLNDPLILSGEFVPYWNGLSHTKETRDKISKKAKERFKENPSINPTLGKHWITNGREDKLIIDGEECPDGWSFGKSKYLLKETALRKIYKNILNPEKEMINQLEYDNLSKEEQKSWDTYGRFDKNDKYISLERFKMLYENLPSLSQLEKLLGRSKYILRKIKRETELKYGKLQKLTKLRRNRRSNKRNDI